MRAEVIFQNVIMKQCRADEEMRVIVSKRMEVI